MSFLKRFFNSPNVEKLQAKGAVQDLIKALDFEDAEVRRQAAKALGEIGDARGITPLTEALKDEEWEVRRQAAEVLGKIGDWPVVEPLIETLKDGEWSVREETARALGNIGHSQAAESLIAALQDTEWRVRREAAQALGKIGDANAVRSLTTTLQDTEWRVRREAVRALGKIGNAQAIESLIIALKDGEWSVRQVAFDALKQIGETKTLEALIAAIKGADASVRQAIFWVIEKIGASAVSPLVAALAGADTSARLAIMWTLEKIGTSAVAPLIVALKDQDWNVRQEAARSLGRLGGTRSTEALIAALNDENMYVRQAAVEALRRIGDARAVKPLMRAFWHADASMRETIGVALYSIGAPAVSPLITALRDSDEKVRIDAIKLLGLIGETKATKPLLDLLKFSAEQRPPVEMRKATVMALRQIGDARAIEPLIAALQDPDASVREAAAWTLGQFDDARSTASLRIALKDTSAHVRETAAKALSHTPAIPADDVRFTAFHPQQVAAEKDYTLLVYAYIESTLEAVRENANRFKEEMIGIQTEVSASTSTLLIRGTWITIQPTCNGVTFNPESQRLKWLEDSLRAVFRFRADKSLAGDAGRGEILIFVGPLLVGALKLVMLFHEDESKIPRGDNSIEVNGQMYKQESIFVSYSHKDTPIVKACRNAYKALGFDILIDSDKLRSGERFSKKLMDLIDNASIFQLFWSKNSKKSKFVRKEWKHALKLNRGDGFIRPVYWKEPMLPPPHELKKIHFAYMPPLISKEYSN